MGSGAVEIRYSGVFVTAAGCWVGSWWLTRVSVRRAEYLHMLYLVNGYLAGT